MSDATAKDKKAKKTELPVVTAEPVALLKHWLRSEQPQVISLARMTKRGKYFYTYKTKTHHAFYFTK